MNHEFGPIDLRTITIPAKHRLLATRYIPAEVWQKMKIPDEIIQVTPRTDAWLASGERTWEEVDTTLEGRIAGFQSVIAKEQEVTSPQARLLAYAELFDEQHTLYHSQEEKVGRLKQQYETQKKTLPTHKRNKLYQTRYAPAINGLVEQQNEKKRIEEVLLRKATMDIFSPRSEANIPFQDLPHILDELPPASQVLAQEFLNHLGTYLKTTKDSELFHRYHYRKSQPVVKTDEDIGVLSDALCRSLAPDHTLLSPQRKKEFQDLSEGYITFLSNRARLTNSGRLGIEPYGNLAFIYDITTAAFATKDTTVIQTCVEKIIAPHYKKVARSASFQYEYDQLAQGVVSAVMTDTIAFRDTLFSLDDMHDATNYRSIEEVPHYWRWVGSHDDIRIMKGIMRGSTRDNRWGFSEKSTLISTYKEMFNSIQDSLRKKCSTIDCPIPEIPLHICINSLVNEINTRRVSMPDGLQHDLASYIGNYRMTADGHFSLGINPQNDTEENRKKFLEYLSEIGSKELTSDEDLNGFMYFYLTLFFGGEKSSSGNVERENTHLVQGILNESRWFVSPRGDRFSSVRDPDLAGKGMDSIQFDIVRNRPREHMVTMNLNVHDYPLRFWVDTSGNLLDEKHQSMAMDADHYQRLRNLILRRLYVITATQHVDGREPQISEEGAGRLPMSWKRAHYRIFPAGSIYTMESQGAQDHAELIKETYGIDIYKEIKRRQDVGTLLPNQVMTFVREVAPTLMDGQESTQPNELPFDPAWIPTHF